MNRSKKRKKLPSRTPAAHTGGRSHAFNGKECAGSGDSQAAVAAAAESPQQQPALASKWRSLTLSRARMIFCLIWTAVFLWLLCTGNYTSFLRPEFGALLVAGGLILAGSFFASRNSSDRRILNYPDLLRLLILLLPVFYIMRGNGASLDGYALNRQTKGLPNVRTPSGAAPTGTTSDAPSASISDSPAGVFGQLPPDAPGMPPPLPSADARKEIEQALQSSTGTPPRSAPDKPTGAPVTLRQLFTDPDLYAGKKVMLLGMVNRNEEVCKIYGEQARLVFRFYFTCCASCTQPLPVVVRSGLEQVPDDAWVCLGGIFRLEEDAQSRKVPLIENPAYQVIKPPTAPYLY